MNHHNTNNYDCSAAGFSGHNGGIEEEVPAENWKEYKATYEGFSSFSGVIKDIKGKYRPGTKQILPIILCNYGQNDYAILRNKKYWNNFKK